MLGLVHVPSSGLLELDVYSVSEEVLDTLLEHLDLRGGDPCVDNEGELGCRDPEGGLSLPDLIGQLLIVCDNLFLVFLGDTDDCCLCLLECILVLEDLCLDLCENICGGSLACGYGCLDVVVLGEDRGDLCLVLVLDEDGDAGSLVLHCCGHEDLGVGNCCECCRTVLLDSTNKDTEGGVTGIIFELQRKLLENLQFGLDCIKFCDLLSD